MKKYRRVHADIDLDAVLFNFEQMNKNIPENTKIMAVVKMVMGPFQSLP